MMTETGERELLIELKLLNHGLQELTSAMRTLAERIREQPMDPLAQQIREVLREL